MKVTETTIPAGLATITVFSLIISVLVFVIFQVVPNPLPILGIAYVLIFIGIAWLYPQLALLLSFALAPFQNDASGNLGPFRFSLTEINILLTSIVFALRLATSNVQLRWGPAILPALLYIGICISSSLSSWSNHTTVPAILQMFLYLIMTVVIFASFVKNEQHFYRACYALIGVCVLFSLVEFTTGSAYVFGIHKNGVGGSLAAGVIVCTELWFASTTTKQKIVLGVVLGIIAAGLLFSLSRGAIAGAVAGLGCLFIYRRQVRLLIQTMLFLMPVAAILWNMLPEEKRENAVEFNTDKQFSSAWTRAQTLKAATDLFQANPITGVGVRLRKELDATNVVMITLAETGVPGLVVFLFLHLGVIRMTWKTQSALAKSDPRYSVPLLATALLMAKFTHGMVDHYWSRGSLSIAWASVGVATGVYYSLRKEQQLATRAKLLRPRTSRAIT